MRTAALPSPRRIAVRSTGTDIWNINGGESLALEYSRWNYHGPAGTHVLTLTYSGDEDHQTSTGSVTVVVTKGKRPPKPGRPRFTR